MERKIGEIFEYNGEWYQCVKGNDCANCVFIDYCKSHSKEERDSAIGLCVSFDRNDGMHVILKRLEKVGKPFSCNYYGDARLVMMQEYQLFDENATYCYSRPPMFVTDYKHKRIAIEIKQNKEDMEDLDKIKVRDYTKVEELNVMEEKKLNLKPFDIQKAREGKPVCTRDGRKARIICFDRKSDISIVALIMGDNDREEIHSYYKDGRSVRNQKYSCDLMMLPEKKEGWVNVYRDCDGINITKDDNIYSSKEAAIASAHFIDGNNYVATTKINWEE